MKKEKSSLSAMSVVCSIPALLSALYGGILWSIGADASHKTSEETVGFATNGEFAILFAAILFFATAVLAFNGLS